MSQQQLLTIAIPTYKRAFEFSRVLDQLSSQLCSLSQIEQASISINILENPSYMTTEKHAIFKEKCFGSCKVLWSQNINNIGQDPNINQAYLSGRDSQYVWVLGDDEQLHINAISMVLSAIASEPSLGLLILLNQDEFPVNKKIAAKKRWPNYYEFANEVFTLQPYLLIAHSLISANVVKSSVYIEKLALKELSQQINRWHLPYCFSHMKAIVGGLSADDDCSVLIYTGPILNTNERSPTNAPVIDDVNEILKLFKLYVFWLIHEFGLNYDLISRFPNMDFFFPSSSALQTVLTRRFTVKVLGLPGRAKRKIKKLVKIFSFA